MKNIVFLLFISSLMFISCKEEPIGQQPVDNIPPGLVTDIKVENIPGGAILTYKLPTDEDLLCVKAYYSLKKDTERSVTSSLYTDTLQIVGFGDTSPREIKVVAVDRSQNVSEPAFVTINPLEPPVITIGKSLRVVPDFGGIQAFWDNPTRHNISIVVLREDNNGEYVPIDTYYSSQREGNQTTRGMDTLEYKFGYFAQDRWENKSETKYDIITPFFETELNKNLFRAITLPNDEPTAWGWVLPNLWDGVISDGNGFHKDNNSPRWPQTVTIDLGTTAKISRIKTFQRQGTWIYQHGNPRLFEIWGSAEFDPTGDWENWIKLINCESIKPSGLPLGQYTSEDQEWAAAGEEFICSPENPPIRYLRMRVLETWSGGSFFHLSEIEVFGDDRF